MRQTRTMRRMPPWIVPALALLNTIPWTIRNIPGLPSTNSRVLLVQYYILYYCSPINPIIQNNQVKLAS